MNACGSEAEAKLQQREAENQLEDPVNIHFTSVGSYQCNWPNRIFFNLSMTNLGFPLLFRVQRGDLKLRHFQILALLTRLLL